MTEQETPTVVVFRVLKTEPQKGEVLALMPEIPASYDETVTAYMHIGQHFGVDFGRATADSRPATPDEYAPLMRELEDIGYSVVPRRRRTTKVRQTFEAERRAIGSLTFTGAQ